MVTHKLRPSLFLVSGPMHRLSWRADVKQESPVRNPDGALCGDYDNR